MLNKRIQQECEERNVSTEIFVKQYLFAIFCKMKQQGKEEISLNSSDLLAILPSLELLFQELGIQSDLFCKEPVSEEYNYFPNYVIQILYANGYGFFNADYNKMFININNYMIQKTLKENEKIADIVDKGYFIMSGQARKIETPVQMVKKEKSNGRLLY